MAVEFKPQRVVDGVGGTGAAVPYPLQWVPFRAAHTFRIQTVGYTGTVDIQGRFPPSLTWENVPYIRRAVGTASYPAPSVAQIAFANSTAVAMITTVEPREVLRLLVDPDAGNAGTITVDVLGVDDVAAILALTSNTVVGGGAVTIADGADVAEGATTDAANTDPTAPATVSADLKGLLKLLNPPGAPTSGHKAVTTSGTQVRLVAGATPCRGVLVTADLANTGAIYVGDLNIDAATFLGTALVKGEKAYFPINDAANLWLDCTVNGEGVGYNVIPL